MTQEENAKAYTELINRLEDVKNAIKKQNYGIAMDILCKPYPDFQITIYTEHEESEDERIRKAILWCIRTVEIELGCKDVEGIDVAELKSWLEKQGEQKLYVNDNAKEMFIKALERVEEQNNKGYKLTDCDKNSWWEDFKTYTSCIIEQKPADKVEPKFHKGDWVVYCNDDVDLITGIEENGYCINNGGYIPFICENEMRLWDIIDAKVGDVLVSESACGLGTWYCIFKSLDGDESMTVHCYLSRDGRFETKKELCFDKDPYSTKPATKEQRDLLFKKMKEAGYEWDAEKKELKKISQRIVSAEAKEAVLNEKQEEQVSEEFINALGTMLNDGLPDRYLVSEERIKDSAELLFSIARKQLKNEMQEWSEEDELIINKILCICDDFAKSFKISHVSTKVIKEDVDKIDNWLKSIKPQPQWKPSEEEMDALHYVTNFDYGGHKATLVSLYEQLKKLK